MAPGKTSRVWLVAAAFLAVYLIWGSTYLAIAVAIETLPGYLMAGTRFLVAGSLLYLIVRARGAPAPRLAQWRPALVVGTLLLFLGNGSVVWAQQFVPSGLTAVLIAVVPLWMVLVEWVWRRTARPAPAVIAGVLLGFLGVAILAAPVELASGGAVHLAGVAALLLATTSWAVGTVYAHKTVTVPSPFLATAMQMLAGGVVLTVFGTLLGEWSSARLDAISTESLVAFSYLVTFGSMVALTAYVWLLRVTTVARVSTYAFVNPVVAVALGAVLLSEPITLRTLVASAVILGGVVLLTMRQARAERAQTPGSAPRQVDEAAGGK